MSMLKDLDEMGREYNRGDRNYFDLLVGMANRGIAQPMGELTSALTPDFIEEPLSQAAGYLADKAGLTDYLQSLDPKTQRRVMESLGAAGIVPVARFGTATAQKAAQAVAPQKMNSDTKGMTRSSGNVFLDGYYGSPVDRKKSIVNFGLDGLYQVAKNIIDPRRPAMYRDFGITPKLRDQAKQVDKAKKQLDDFLEGNVEKYRTLAIREKHAALPKPKKKAKISFKDYYNQVKDSKEFNDDRVNQFVEGRYKNSLELFQAQLQASGHIRQQAGANRGNVRDVAEEAAEMASARSGKTYFTAGEFSGDWMNKAANFDIKKPSESVIPVSRARRFQKFITDTWENAAGIDVSSASLYVKRPAGKYTGDHNRDIALNQKTVENIRNIFLGPDGKTMEPHESKSSLLTELKREQEYNEKNKNKSRFSIIGEDEDGFFVQYSFAGSSKPEGGVNSITHVDKEGILTTVVSDVHDMSVGGVMKPLGAYLDYSLGDELSVTPPMIHNLITKKNKNTGNKISKEKIEEFQDDVKSLRPRMATLADEVDKRIGAGLAVTSQQEREPLERDPETGDVIVRITK